MSPVKKSLAVDPGVDRKASRVLITRFSKVLMTGSAKPRHKLGIQAAIATEDYIVIVAVKASNKK
jgi:hypothetical protein